MKTIELSQIHPILGSIRSTTVPPREGGEPRPPQRRPFVTISRQAGAGAWALAQELVAHLNAVDGGAVPWTGWDRELVEKVAADHHISAELVESLERGSRSWLMDLLAGFSFGEGTDEFAVYRRVAATIRALALAGRVVIVGRGGVHVTHDMPGGVHVRLIAPLAHRVSFMGNRLGVNEAEAARQIRALEADRERFHRTHWPRAGLGPETFTVTYNTALVGEAALVQSIAALVLGSGHAAAVASDALNAASTAT